VKRGSAATVLTTLLSSRSVVRIEVRALESRLGRVAIMRARAAVAVAAAVAAAAVAVLAAAAVLVAAAVAAALLAVDDMGFERFMRKIINKCGPTVEIFFLFF